MAEEAGARARGKCDPDLDLRTMSGRAEGTTEAGAAEGGRARRLAKLLTMPRLGTDAAGAGGAEEVGEKVGASRKVARTLPSEGTGMSYWMRAERV